MAQRSLKEATLNGVRWVMLARIFSETLALVAAVALARMIPPAEFGRAAVAMIFIPLSTILTFEGFSSALVQRRTIEESHRRAAVLMSLIGGLALSALALLLARTVAEPVFGGQIADLVALVSPVFLIASLGGVSRATLWRRLDFPRTSRIDVVSLLTGSIVAISCAAAGLDGEAIVLGGLAQSAACTLQLVIAAPPPLPRWHARSQREITGFGLPAALAGLVHVLFSNIAYVILAARVTTTQTGIYWRGFNLGVTYQDKLSNVMLQVSFPVYARTSDRAELRRLHERATRVHAAVIVPLLASLIVLAPILVPLVFGPAWTPAVELTQILAVAGMIMAILTGYAQVMLAIGKPRELLQFNLVMLVMYSAAIVLASGHGLVAVAVTVVGVHVAILLSVYRFLLDRHVGIPTRALLGELTPAVVGAVALLAVAWPLRELLDAVGSPGLVTLVTVGPVGLTTYAIVLRARFGAVWQDLWLLAERVVPPLRRLPRRLATPPRVGAPAVAASSGGGPS